MGAGDEYLDGADMDFMQHEEAYREGPGDEPVIGHMGSYLTSTDANPDYGESSQL